MKILVVSQFFWMERGREVSVLTEMPNYATGCLFGEYISFPDAEVFINQLLDKLN